MLKAISIIVITLTLFSCDSGIKWEDEKYVVSWLDTSSNSTLAYKLGNGTSIGRVKARVMAVGSDKKYVVAKRIKPRSKLIQYFYVDKRRDKRYLNLDQITQGPFTEESFLVLKKDLGLPEFTKEF